MTDRIATAWQAYLAREAPFVSTSHEEKYAEVAAKRAFIAGAAECLMFAMEPRGPEETLAHRVLAIDAELADFARDVAEGNA